jgi:sodium/hydrogen antiporter
VFALLALLVVRPIALGIALFGSGLDWREQAAAAWFGPKGFASVVYGILILKAGIVRGDELFHLLAVVIAGSIIAHSSTDVMVARWFQKAEAEPAELPSSRGG